MILRVIPPACQAEELDGVFGSGAQGEVCVSGYRGGGVGRVCVCVCVCFRKECVCGGVAGGVFGLPGPHLNKAPIKLLVGIHWPFPHRYTIRCHDPLLLIENHK